MSPETDDPSDEWLEEMGRRLLAIKAAAQQAERFTEALRGGRLPAPVREIRGLQKRLDYWAGGLAINLPYLQETLDAVTSAGEALSQATKGFEQ
jgi:hypothetical protein